MSKHNLSDFTNEEPTVEVEAMPEVVGKEEAKTGEEGETLELTELAEDEGETGENGTGEPEGDEEAKPKGKKPIQERFDKMAAKIREADERAEHWRAIAEGRAKPQAEPVTEVAETKLERPDPSEFEFGEADPAYFEALTDWKVETRLAKAEQGFQEKQRKAEVRTVIDQLEKGYVERVASVKEEIPDYDEVVTQSAARGEWPLPPLVALAAKESKAGPKILHYLATNLDEAIEISELSPIEQAVAFGRLEARFLNAPKVQAKVTQAPPPPKTLSRGSGGQFATSERQLYQKMLKEFR